MDQRRCLDDAELLAAIECDPSLDSDLLAHLDACQPCQGRFERLRRESQHLCETMTYTRPHVTAGTERAPDNAPSASPEHPEIIGEYPVLEFLGFGGQAKVYRSEHPRLGVSVAIKLAHEPLGDDASLLVAEARQLASLNIDGVARVYDIGLHEGRPYVVMRMLHGVDLRRQVFDNSLSHRQIAELMAHIAHIVAKAHTQGIVHRDLKPANIIIDSEGRPTIIDFGMAMIQQPWKVGDDRSGGTVGFMSPEQAAATRFVGEAAPMAKLAVGPRSDIFSLGAVVYCLLTGRPPYEDDKLTPKLIQRVRSADFDRAALAAANIPPRLANICLKAMNQEPAKRYTSAAALARDLERFARPPWKRRYLLLPGLAGAAILMAALVAVRRQSESPPPPAAQLLVETIERDELLTPKTAEALAECLPLSPDDAVRLACDVPRGAPVGLFYIDANGNVGELSPFHVGPGGEHDHLVFPARGNWHVEGGPGTLALLAIVGRREKPRLDDIRQLFTAPAGDMANLPADWPKLDANTLLVLNRDKLEPFGDKPMGIGDSAYSRVYDRLNALREALAARYDNFWGIALPRDTDR